MSKDEPPKSYEVGFKRPPAAHRFQKGRSGNPRGRPRKTATAAQPLDPGNEPAIEMLLSEAYRTVTIREGETQVELPVIQAVYRSLGLAAIKGNRHAAKSFAELVSAREAGKREQKFEFFKAMYEYRESWLEVFAQCDAEGRPRPDPVPHPDDIELNPHTCEAIVRGPWTEEQRDLMLEICQRRDDCISENEMFAELMAGKELSPQMARLIAQNEAHIAKLEAMLPERMRRNKDWLKERIRARREKRLAAGSYSSNKPALRVVHSRPKEPADQLPTESGDTKEPRHGT